MVRDISVVLAGGLAFFVNERNMRDFALESRLQKFEAPNNVNEGIENYSRVRQTLAM
jgi:hypothetical protein